MTERQFTALYPQLASDLEQVPHRGGLYFADPTRSAADKHYYKPVTPEEKVRQAFLVYLIDNLALPKATLATERSLGALGGTHSKARRVDLVISGPAGPLMVVEFKREDSSLIAEAYGQGSEYVDSIGAPYLLLCNGRTMRLFESHEGGLRPLQSFPKELHALRDERLLESRPLLGQQTVASDYFNIGTTPPWAEPLLRLMFNSILRGDFSGLSSRQFRIFQDLGSDWGSFRNASGSPMGVYGTFRFLELEFPDGGRDILGLTIMRYDKPIAELRPGNKIIITIGGKSCLEMATKDKQLFVRDEDQVTLVHSGKVAVKGATARDNLVAMSAEVPDLIQRQRSRVEFGVVSIYPDADNLARCIFNMARYAVVREALKLRLKSGVAAG